MTFVQSHHCSATVRWKLLWNRKLELSEHIKFSSWSQMSDPFYWLSTYLVSSPFFIISLMKKKIHFLFLEILDKKTCGLVIKRHQCCLMNQNGSKDFWLQTLITYLFATNSASSYIINALQFRNFSFILCPSWIRSPLNARSE